MDEINEVTLTMQTKHNFFKLGKVYEINWNRYPTEGKQLMLPAYSVLTEKYLGQLTKYARFDGILHINGPEGYVTDNAVIFAAVMKDGTVNKFVKASYTMVSDMIKKGHIRLANKTAQAKYALTLP